MERVGSRFVVLVNDLVRDWDAQIAAANGDDVVASIGILRCSQRAHQAWLDYIEEGEYPDQDRQDGLMESEFHRRCVDQYEHIINVIQRLAASSNFGNPPMAHRLYVPKEFAEDAESRDQLVKDITALMAEPVPELSSCDPVLVDSPEQNRQGDGRVELHWVCCDMTMELAKSVPWRLYVELIRHVHENGRLTFALSSTEQSQTQS